MNCFGYFLDKIINVLSSFYKRCLQPAAAAAAVYVSQGVVPAPSNSWRLGGRRKKRLHCSPATHRPPPGLQTYRTNFCWRARVHASVRKWTFCHRGRARAPKSLKPVLLRMYVYRLLDSGGTYARNYAHAAPVMRASAVLCACLAFGSGWEGQGPTLGAGLWLPLSALYIYNIIFCYYLMELLMHDMNEC